MFRSVRGMKLLPDVLPLRLNSHIDRKHVHVCPLLPSGRGAAPPACHIPNCRCNLLPRSVILLLRPPHYLRKKSTVHACPRNRRHFPPLLPPPWNILLPDSQASQWFCPNVFLPAPGLFYLLVQSVFLSLVKSYFQLFFSKNAENLPTNSNLSHILLLHLYVPPVFSFPPFSMGS